MNKLLRYVLIFILIPGSLIGQSDGATYAVTSEKKGSNDWVALRTLNTGTGKFSSMLLNMNNKELPQYDITTHRLLDKVTGPVVLSNTVVNNAPTPVVNTGVAALAYDQKTNRLFYVPMNDDNLRYIDLTTMKVYSDAALSFSKAGNYIFRSTSPVTRLVITPDGYGYTITTDGNHLIRFTTNDKPVLTNLGELVDDPHNKEMTALNPCANAGGDMVADDAGNLYLITAANRVFMIDVNTRVATYLATITGLPAGFTTNGAAVDENGKLIISSSMFTEASFIVDHKTWKAVSSPVQQQVYGIADLASSNVLQTRKTIPSLVLFDRPVVKTGITRIYPNPVLFDEVTVQFSDLPAGKYTIELADPLGRKVLKQKVTVTRQTQTTIMKVPTATAQAFYYVRILNEKNILVSTHKLALERW
ncbi:MAG TPA: T9SS type A sorting domain-containing protein [Niastella sp.]